MTRLRGGPFVTGLGLWAPGFRDLAAWRSGDRTDTAPPTGGLPAREQRRATMLGRMAGEVLLQACAEARVAPAAVGMVLGTVGGEFAVTFEALEMTTADPPTSSPLRFRNTVHNAALGALGIAHGNVGYASALSADAERVVAMSLIEGIAWLSDHGGHVAVLIAEDAWPDRDHLPLATAIVLSEAPAVGAAVRGRLTELGRGRVSVPASDAGAWASCPIAGVLPVIEALDAGVAASVVLSTPRADGTAWTARLAPVPR